MASTLSLIILSVIAFLFTSTNARERLATRNADDSTDGKTGGAYDTYQVALPLDHFNNDDDRTFQNRFFVNDTYYKPGGPVFLKPAGEGQVDEDLIESFLAPRSSRRSALMSLARQFDGLAILLEHRYYGESQPFEYDNDTGILLDGEDYEFLTLEQGLEDIVYFSTHLPSMTPALEPHLDSLSPGNTPWIMVGGSYPGVQSAIMRLRNPDIIFASWASSAPVESRPDMSTQGNALRRALPVNCSADIREAIAFIDDALGGDNETARDLLGTSLWLAVQAKSQSEITEANVTAARRRIENLSTYNLSRYMGGWSYSFQSRGLRDIWPFCDSIETFNPETAGVIGDFSTTFNNSRDAKPTTKGLAATWGAEIAANAFISAIWQQRVDIAESSVPDSVGNPPDFLHNPSWAWQRLTEFGNWWVGNGSDPQSLRSVHTTVKGSVDYDVRLLDVTVPVQAPATDRYNKYGGWDMNPSHVMFTDGTWDGWMARSVLALREDGGPGRSVSSVVPSCNSELVDDDVFGLVYQGAGHGDDLTWVSGKMRGFTYAGYPYEEGLPLFVKALREWIPCFETHTTTRTNSTEDNAKDSSATSLGPIPSWDLFLSLWWAIIAALVL